MSDTLQQLDDIILMIAQARDSVRTGVHIDLMEIQGLVHDVCTELQQSPPEDGAPVHDKIVAMIADLNVLAEELTAQQKQTGSEVIRRAVRKSYLKGQDN